MAQDIGVTFHDLSSNVFEFLKVSSDCDVSELRKKWTELTPGNGDVDKDPDLHVFLCSGVEIPAEGSIQALLAPGSFVLALQVERTREISVQLAGSPQKSVKVKVHPRKSVGAILSDAKRSLGVKKDREARLLLGEEALSADGPLPERDDEQEALLDLKLSVLVLDGSKLLPPLVEVAGELSFSGEWSMSSSGGQQWASCFATESATCLMQAQEQFSRQRLIETNNMRSVTEECRVGDLLEDLEILSRRTAMAILEKQISLTIKNLMYDETTTVLTWPSMKIGSIFTNAEDVLHEGALLDKEKSFFEAGIAADICLTVSRMLLLEITDIQGRTHALHVPHGTTLAEVREQAKAFEELAFFKVSHNGAELICDARPVSELQSGGPVALKLFCLTRDVEVSIDDEVRLLTDVSEVVQFDDFLEMVGEAFNQVLPPEAEFHCPCGRVFSREVRQRKSFPIRCCEDQVLSLTMCFASEQQPSAPPPPYESLDFPHPAPASAPALRGSDLPQIIRFLLAAKGNLHFQDSSGRSLSHLAAQEGSCEALRFLVDAGAKLGAPRKDGVLPLHLAAFHGHLDAVRLLLGHSVADSRANDLRTPLHYAAQAGHVEVVRELLQHKIDVNAGTKVGFTPLHLASFGGHAEVVQLLVAHGCALNQPTNSSFGPLHCAAQNGHLQATLALIQAGCDMNYTTSKGLSALHTAVTVDQVAVARALVEAGLNVNFPSQIGFTPLHTAAYNGRLESARFLLEAGADPNARTNQGAAPLYFAVQRNQTAVVALLTSGNYGKSDVNAQTEQGQAALHVAALENRTEAARMLLSAGADVNLPKKDGLTALHVAVVAGHLEIAQLLVSAGADLNRTSAQGSTPLHLAVQKNRLELGRLLVGAGCEVNKDSLKGFAPLHQAVQWKNADFVRLLLDNGADATLATQPKGITPLHIAAEQDLVAIAQQLIEAGAEVNAQSQLGSCPLHMAARKGSAAAAQLLIGAGCDIDCVTENVRHRPLHDAAKEGHAEVVAALIAAKAQLGATTEEGKTALHVAAEEGRLEVVKALVDAGAEVAARTEEGATAEELAAAKGHQAVVKALRGGGPLSFLKAFKK